MKTKTPPPLKTCLVRDIEFFKQRFWTELNRYDENGNYVEHITCFEENYINLYNSQFDTPENRYGKKYFYK